MIFPKKASEPIAPKSVMIAKKPFHVGALFGHLSNGGGSIDLGNNYSLQFVRDGSDFVKIQLFHHAIDARVEVQSWTKSVKVVEKRVDESPKEVQIQAKVERASLL
jgi:hypothetical protein